MLRQPKYTKSEYKKVLKGRYKRPETIEKYLTSYTEKISAFKQQQSFKNRAERKNKTLFKNYQKQIKGKSRDQIKKLSEKYQNKKQKNKENVKQFSRGLLDIKKPVKISDLKRKAKFEENFNLGKSDIQNKFISLYEQLKSDYGSPHYVLIIVEGINKNSCLPQLASESKSKIEIERDISSGSDFMDEVLDKIKSYESGQTIVLKNVAVRFIFNISDEDE